MFWAMWAIVILILLGVALLIFVPSREVKRSLEEDDAELGEGAPPEEVRTRPSHDDRTSA